MIAHSCTAEQVQGPGSPLFGHSVQPPAAEARHAEPAGQTLRAATKAARRLAARMTAGPPAASCGLGVPSLVSYAPVPSEHALHRPNLSEAGVQEGQRRMQPSFEITQR